eukprot:jgi/Psemu1/284670/fgenesh1_pg.60_\
MARNSNTQLLALILACAALFAIHPSSAFHILQTTPSRRIPSTAAGNRRNINNNRKLQHHRATKVLAASLAASAGVVAGAPSPALARTFADNMIDGTQTYSLRPGVTREQAEKLTSGVMPDEAIGSAGDASKMAKSSFSGISKTEGKQKTVVGPQGGGDGLGGPSRRDYDDNGDDDGPSEDDIRKLGDLFNK